MIETPAWKSLTAAQRAVYILIAARYDGRNNGRIALGHRDAAALCNINRQTAGAAFRRLQETGFIELVTAGAFNRKTSHATEWRLNIYVCDVTGEPPSNAFRRWSPEFGLTALDSMTRAGTNGRSKPGGTFIQIHHFMMGTPAWGSLTPAQRAVYVAIAARYDGKNNGRIALSHRDGANLCNINRETAGSAFHRLQEIGFIELVTPGGFSRKTPHAAEWRLTMYLCNVTDELPSKAFLRWCPSGGATGLDSKTRAGTRARSSP
jgi:DNA-binding transcriptional regulator YhcF (GntR family)